MIEIISIHIPKTGGTSFYEILKQVYGNRVSLSYKREHYNMVINNNQDFYQSIPDMIKVFHGHIYYHELKSVHFGEQSKMICWLRDPVERVVSNYLFFKRGLANPERNPLNYKLNKHRKNESLINYARRSENQNRMADFIRGIDILDFFFVGILESFDRDIGELAQLLKWPEINIPTLNVNPKNQSDTSFLKKEWIEEIASLNFEDVQLYQRALTRKN